MIWRFAEIEVYEEQREVRRAGLSVPVEPKVFDLILHLVRNRHRVVPKEELLDTLWPEQNVFENALSVCIHRARVALGRGRIRNFARRGYRFIEEPNSPAGSSDQRDVATASIDRASAEAELLAAEKAAFAAFSKVAFAEAAVWFKHAADLVERFLPAERSRRARLLIGLGESLLRTGDETGATRAFRLAEAASKGVERSTRASESATFHPPEVDRLLALMRAGVEVPADPTGADSDQALTERVNAVERAAEEARRTGDVTGLASALVSRRWLASSFDMPSARLRLSTEAALLARSLELPHLLQEARLLHIHDLLENGDVSAAHAAMDAYADAAARLDSPVYHWVAAYLAATREHVAGRFAAAEGCALDAMGKAAPLAPEQGAATFTTQILTVKAYQGRTGEMVAVLEMFVDRYPQQPIGHANLASVYCELGRLDEGRRELDRAMESELSAGMFRGMVLPHTIAALARVCWTLRESDRAATLYDTLLPWSGTQLVVPLAVAVIGPIDAFLALLAQAAGRWKTAARHYQCAIDSCIATDNRAVLAQTQYQYADGLLSHGQPGAASDVLDSAERIAAELNLSGLAEWITRLRREHKLGAGL